MLLTFDACVNKWICEYIYVSIFLSLFFFVIYLVSIEFDVIENQITWFFSSKMIWKCLLIYLELTPRLILIIRLQNRFELFFSLLCYLKMIWNLVIPIQIEPNRTDILSFYFFFQHFRKKHIFFLMDFCCCYSFHFRSK